MHLRELVEVSTECLSNWPPCAYHWKPWNVSNDVNPSSLTPEAALQRCSYKKVLWKYAAYLKKNTHAEVWFQLKFQSSFIEIILPHGCCPENLLHVFRALFIRTPPEGSFCKSVMCRQEILRWLLLHYNVIVNCLFYVFLIICF